MSFYHDDQQLYTCLRTLFDRIDGDSPDGIQALLESRLIIRLRCNEPVGQVTIDGRRSPPQVTYGSSPLRPDLAADLAGDTLHRILLDELPMRVAIAKGLMQVRGPVWKMTALADLIRAGRQFYPQVLKDLDLHDGQ